MPIVKDKLIVNIDYKPKPKQSVFHQALEKYRLYIGAWRSGKTFSACQEALKKSILYPNNRGLVGRYNYTDLRDTTLRTLLDVIPKEYIKNHHKTEHRITLHNGSEILYRDLKDETGLGSLDLGWFFIDEAEEVSENIFTRLKGRLSLKKVGKTSGWLASNPPNKNHWLYRHFEEKETPNSFTIHATTYENKENLPEGYIDDLEKLPESWKKKYLEGEYGFTPDGKPFYQGFIERLHRRQIQWNGSKIYRVWDYGFLHPAVSFHFIDSKGRWIIHREIMGENITIEKFGNYIKTMCKEWYPNAEYEDFGDPAGEQKSDKSEKTSVEILASMGIYVTSKQSTYRERKEIIERKLTTLIEEIPAVIVNDSCKIIIDGFLGGYHYPVMKQGQAFDPRRFEIPYHDDYYSHLMNTIEYFAVNMFTGAETKKDNTIITHKVVGSMKDIHFDVEEDEDTNYGAYQRVTSGRI